MLAEPPTSSQIRRPERTDLRKNQRRTDKKYRRPVRRGELLPGAKPALPPKPLRQGQTLGGIEEVSRKAAYDAVPHSNQDLAKYWHLRFGIPADDGRVAGRAKTRGTRSGFHRRRRSSRGRAWPRRRRGLSAGRQGLQRFIPDTGSVRTASRRLRGPTRP